MALLSDAYKNMLNRNDLARFRAELGTRIQELEQMGTVAIDFDGAHADYTISESTLGSHPVYYINCTNADAAANVILPSTPREYLINNGSGYTVTFKLSGSTGVAVETSIPGILYCDGSEIYQAADYMADSNPTITDPNLTFGVSTHDYEAAAADWTLTTTEGQNFIVSVTNASGAVNAIAPADTGRAYFVRNDSGYTLTFLVSGETGVTIETGTGAVVYCDGTDYVQISDCLEATTPTISSPNLTFGITTHDYGAAAVDWTLSTSEGKTTILSTSNASGVVNAIAPNDTGRVFFVVNGAGYALTIKVSGETGVSIADGSGAVVYCNGTDYVQIV